MKVFLTSLFFLVGFFVRAQQDRFIYLQTENKQPFFVKLNDKVFNSSPLGYVIIPSLQDGVYSLKIGSPQWISEQEFNCSIHNKDVGFVIKNGGENQWQLMDVQSRAVIVPGLVATKISKDTLQKETDPFSTMLANAVNDSTILQKDIVKEVVPEKASDVLQKDSSEVVTAKTEIVTAKSEVAIAKPVAKKKVKKIVHPTKDTVEEQKRIPTETVINNPPQDTAHVVAVRTDTASSRPATVTDAVTTKEVAKQIVADKAIEPLQKDSLLNTTGSIEIKRDTVQQVVANTDAKPIAKQKIKRKTKPVSEPDSPARGNDMVVVNNDNKADSLTHIADDNTVAKITTKQKIKRKKSVEGPDRIVNESNEAKREDKIPIKDTAQVLAAGNEVSTAPAKLKVKRKKKNDLQDTALVNVLSQNNDSTANNKLTKDPVQDVAAGNDVSAVATKQKVKRKKKADHQETAMVKEDVTKPTDAATVNETNKSQSPPFINFDNTATPLSIIKRKSRKSTREGLEMLYVDVDGDTRDTIRVLIPVEKRIRVEAKPESSAETSSVTVVTPTRSETINTEQKNKINKEPIAKVAMINSDCKSVATDDDFMKMRKKMVAENDDEGMVRAAKKVFKTKCFTTEQIKNLSVLFLKDQGKYMFFDAAYPFAADTELYSTLQSQLTDEYYITRFRAMIHK